MISNYNLIGLKDIIDKNNITGGVYSTAEVVSIKQEDGLNKLTFCTNM